LRGAGGDVAQWFIDVVGPAIEAKFNGNASTADLIQESSKTFGQQTGQRLALMFLANEAQRQRDVAIKNGVNPQGVIQGITDKDYAANLDNLGKSIQGFAQVLGGPSIELAIGGLHLITGAVQELTKAAAISPQADKAAIEMGFGPALFGGAWNAFEDLRKHLSGILWGSPAQAATLAGGPYANGGGSGEAFKGAATLASPVPVTVVPPTPGAHPGRDVHSPQTGPLAYTPAAAPPQPVNTTANVKVDVFVDAELVASKIASAFESAFRLPGSSAGADGGANHMPPDAYNF
jgi:hypothetical protein